MAADTKQFTERELDRIIEMARSRIYESRGNEERTTNF